MTNLSEEEIKERLKHIEDRIEFCKIHNLSSCTLSVKTQEMLLDLYTKEKEKNKALEEINFRVNLNVIELEEKNNRQLEIDTAEEVLKWKSKYHLLSRKINGVLEDKIKEEITYWKEAEKLGTRNDEEYYRAMCQYKYGVLEDILKESDI